MAVVAGVGLTGEVDREADVDPDVDVWAGLGVVDRAAAAAAGVTGAVGFVTGAGGAVLPAVVGPTDGTPATTGGADSAAVGVGLRPTWSTTRTVNAMRIGMA